MYWTEYLIPLIAADRLTEALFGEGNSLSPMHSYDVLLLIIITTMALIPSVVSSSFDPIYDSLMGLIFVGSQHVMSNYLETEATRPTLIADRYRLLPAPELRQQENVGLPPKEYIPVEIKKHL